jgi:hypothetical protein
MTRSEQTPSEHEPLAGVSPHEQELLGTQAEYANYSIEMGTVGWEGDQGNHFDINKDADDGTTLIKVQLYRGKRPLKEVKPGIAQGHQILAQLSGPTWHVPDKGQRVLVAMPGGMEDVVGAAVIVAMPGPAPSSQYTQTKSKLDVGPDHDLVIKGRSITITDYSNRFISVTSDGLIMQDTDGSGIIIKEGKIQIFSTNKTVIQLDDTLVQIFNSAGGLIKLDSAGNSTLFGTNVYCQGAGVYLGLAPTALTTAAIYPLVAGVPPPSTTVFISP